MLAWMDTCMDGWIDGWVDGGVDGGAAGLDLYLVHIIYWYKYYITLINIIYTRY